LGEELGDIDGPVADPTIAIDDLVDRLMGKNAERRFEFIQDNAEFAQDIDI
jgi:topoisomerase-4 subunit B